MRRRQSGLRVLPILLVTAGACLDGPFARVNQHDPKNRVEYRLESPVDTVRGLGTIVEFMLETTPAVALTNLHWGSSRPQEFESLGNGVYRLRAIPSGPEPVTVTVGWDVPVASVVVVITP